MKHKIKGVLFDLDQTFCNTEDFFLSPYTVSKNAYKQLAEYQLYAYLKEKLKIISWDKFRDVYFKSRNEIKTELKGTSASHNRYLYIQRTLENLNSRFRPGVIYKAVQIYWDYIIKKSILFPNVKKVLETIKQNSIKTAIISDLTADIQIKKLERLSIEKYIDFLITSEEANSDKPDRKQADLALKKLELNRDEVIIVGNNPKTDIQLAKKLKITSVLFDYYKIYKDQSKSATFYIDNFLDILQILNIQRAQYSKEKLVVFDLIGTLTSEKHLVSNLLTNFLKKETKLIRKYYELYKVGEITQKEFWSGLKVKDYNDIERVFLNKIEITGEKIALLKRLKSRYKLAILSNIPKEWGYEIIKRFELDRLMEEVVFSGEHGTKKPDPNLYKILLSKFPRINPSNIYFVDDDLEDLSAGKSFLMNTIWLENKDQDVDFIPDYVVKELSEVEEIVEVENN